MLSINSLLIPTEEIKYQAFWNECKLYITPYRMIYFHGGNCDIILFKEIICINIKESNSSCICALHDGSGAHSLFFNSDDIELMYEIQCEIMKAKTNYI